MNGLPRTYLDRTRRRLGIEDPEEVRVFEDFVEDAIRDILNFCNRDDLPPGLYHEAARIAGEAYMLGRIANVDPEVADESVSSASMAGVKLTFGMTADRRAVVDKMIEERIARSDTLRQFRLLRRVAMPKKTDDAPPAKRRRNRKEVEG